MLTSDTLVFNLTTTNSAYGTNPLKSLGGGVWGLFAADGNADGQAIASDFNSWLVSTKAVATGYVAPDYNLDGNVIASDFNLWLANTKATAVSQVP